jgi:CHAT domain-containing protein
VVASMWKVSDNATAFWMTRFYEARFVRDLSLPEAVHAASRETFETLRERHESESPWRWAAFSSSGDWR